MDIDDILHEEDIVEISLEQRKRIKFLDEIIAYNQYVVELDSKSNRQFYNFCRRNACPKKGRHALMNQEQYLLFRLMDIGHSYVFYPELKRKHVQNFESLFEWQHRRPYLEDYMEEILMKCKFVQKISSMLKK